MRCCTIIILAALFGTSAAAADFKFYANSRFGYMIDLPSDFKTVIIPDNEDGVGLESPVGSAKLWVWGNYLTQGNFRQESDLQKKFESDDGWRFTYEKRGASWASLSGTKGDRIVYMRQIALCDDAMGNFTFEYPAAMQKHFEPVVDHMVKTLKAAKNCD